MKNRIPQEAGKPRTYVIRGKEVMLDRDLAKLYGVSMGVFNARVNRHIERFPARVNGDVLLSYNSLQILELQLP